MAVPVGEQKKGDRELTLLSTIPYHTIMSRRRRAAVGRIPKLM